MGGTFGKYKDDPQGWHRCLKIALRHTFASAGPMTDEQILIDATYSFGIEGGASGPDDNDGPGYEYSYKGCSHRHGATEGKFWAGSMWGRSANDKPLQGKWLAHAIRETFQIEREGTLL